LSTIALPVRRAIADVTIGRGAIAFWLCVPLVLGMLMIARNSSVVAVEQVRIVGLDGHYEKNARKALNAQALTMTTLNVDGDALRASIAEFVDIAGLEYETDFPNGLTVSVDVRRPVAVVRAGSRLTGVTADGMMLETTRNLSVLPRIDLQGGWRDGRLSGAVSLRLLTVLGAAPDVLLRRVKSIKSGARGIVVTLDKGVLLIFGDTALADVKWRSAAAVLADPEAKGVRYIDLRVADRPAIGGLGAAPVSALPGAEAPAAATPEEVQQRYDATTGQPQTTTPQVGTTPAPGAGTAPAQPAPAPAPQPSPGGGTAPQSP
jgi:cell division septal protein FtsQ